MTDIKVPVLTYSRVSGYYNPVIAFNKGKREEFSERKMITLEGVLNAIRNWKNRILGNRRISIPAHTYVLWFLDFIFHLSFFSACLHTGVMWFYIRITDGTLSISEIYCGTWNTTNMDGLNKGFMLLGYRWMFKLYCYFYGLIKWE